MRAKTRAMAVSAGAALIVVPLSGAAAVAITGGAPATPNAEAVAQQGAELAQQVEQIGAPVSANSEASFAVSTPALDVTKDPVVVVTRTTTATSSSARPVANSADVAQAIGGSAIIAEAAKYVGTPYLPGGTTPGGFDCSGFVSYVYGQFGISLPHSSGAYFSVGTRVDTPQPGDIIVTPGHVGLYAGPNLQIDAPRSGKTIQFRAIWQTNPVYVRVTG